MTLARRVALTTDLEDHVLDGVLRIASTTLDGEVGRGDGLDRASETDAVPSARRRPRLVDLPGWHPQLLREIRTASTAGRGDLGDLAQLRGEDGDDRHGIDPGGERVAQQPQGLGRVAGDGRVGHAEARRLHLAAVVGADGVLVDDAARVVDELTARRGELRGVLAGRLEQRREGEAARRPTVRLWAEGAPKELKDLLKARRYRWSPARRTWYIDLDEAQIEIEHDYLAERIYRRPVTGLPSDRFTARDRFSYRTNPEV